MGKMMGAGKSLILATAALAAAALLFAAMPGERGSAGAPKPGTEPNLFPFLKPLQAAAPSTQAPAPAAAPPTPGEIAMVQAEARKMRAQGAAGEEIDRMRAAALPPQTAMRLALVEAAEAKWKSRVDAYLAERSRLLDAVTGVPETQRETALRLLRDSSFTAEEQAQLAAYETAGLPQLTRDE